MINVILIGTGVMGKTHYAAYKSLEGVNLAAVVDSRGETVRADLGDDAVPIYTSLESAMAEHTADVVDICTPTPSHVPLSIQAMEAGAHVLCEKPMSIAGDEAAKITAAAKATGKCCMIAQVVRFMAPYAYLKSVIDSGELGRPVKLELKRLSGMPRWSPDSWFADFSKSGGSLMDMNLHDIDFCRYAFGEPEKISGVYHKLKEDNDFIDAALIYSDFVVNVNGGWYSHPIPFCAEYYAVLQGGTIVYRDGKLLKNDEEVDLSAFSYTTHTGLTLTGEDGYRDEIEYFLSCVKEGVEPEIVNAESAEGSVRLVERIRESVQVI